MEVTWKFYKNDGGKTLISPQQGRELSGRQMPPVTQGPFINVTQSLHHLFRLTPGWSFWNSSQPRVRISCCHHLSLPPNPTESMSIEHWPEYWWSLSVKEWGGNIAGSRQELRRFFFFVCFLSFSTFGSGEKKQQGLPHVRVRGRNQHLAWGVLSLTWKRFTSPLWRLKGPWCSKDYHRMVLGGDAQGQIQKKKT